jgi:tRNA-specific 2-thiouridylase
MTFCFFKYKISMNRRDKKTVFVGVSGGVDSSVSAALLKKQGYEVVGVFIRTWTPDFIDCTWRDERRDAMRVCAHLGIPFLECDAEEAYKKGVADYMIEEYKKGNTPNPDVMCNREVKFGVFWDFAKKHSADFIATGHYAISDNGLQKSADASKDQTYFLWTLTKEDLSHTLFPVGHLEKKDVRTLAQKFNLPTATKKDSQGVCFLGPLDMKDFLKHYIESREGEVLNMQGEVIGTHDGAVFFTLGERHGFTVTSKTSVDTPYYVVGKDIEKNTITVSPTLLQETNPLSIHYNIEKINWISGIPTEEKKYTAQIRYHGEEYECTITSINEKTASITFSSHVIVSKGQSIVVYDASMCIGGGIVA